MNKHSNPTLHRIIVGVTGHRTLTNIDLLLEKISSILKNKIPEIFAADIKEGSDKTISYTLITLLGEGADRLVAKAVLDFNKYSDIHVILPMNLTDYQKTFKDPLDKEFDELFQKAAKVISLEIMDSKSESSEITSIMNSNKLMHLSKEESFLNAGKHMVDNSDVLIALWDGKAGRGKGGTKDIIDYAEEKKLPTFIVYT